jgi:hypothetical protein
MRVLCGFDQRLLSKVEFSFIFFGLVQFDWRLHIQMHLFTINEQYDMPWLSSLAE